MGLRKKQVLGFSFLLMLFLQPSVCFADRYCDFVYDKAVNNRLDRLGYSANGKYGLELNPELTEIMMNGGMSIAEIRDRAPSVRYRGTTPFSATNKRNSVLPIRLFRVVKGVRDVDFDPSFLSGQYGKVWYFAQELDTALRFAEGEGRAIVIEIEVPAFLVYRANSYPVISQEHLSDLTPFIVRQGSMSEKKLEQYKDSDSVSPTVRWQD